MALKGNRGWAKMLAEAVKQAVDDPNYEPGPRPTYWVRTWIDPVPRRERYRRWLSMWLKGALSDVPSDVSARYLEEMAEDIRFIDKVLPKLLPNEPRDKSLAKSERFL
jgi:hypothetical protein